MQDFKYKDKTVGFFAVTGTVLSSDKREETTVHSSGGGGRVGQYGGYVAAPQVYSSSVTHHDLWLKKEDGEEQCVRLIGSDIPVRPGQQITAVYAGLRQQQADFTGYPTIIFNHDARRHWMLYTGEKLNNLLDIAKKELPWPLRVLALIVLKAESLKQFGATLRDVFLWAIFFALFAHISTFVSYKIALQMYGVPNMSEYAQIPREMVLPIEIDRKLVKYLVDPLVFFAAVIPPVFFTRRSMLQTKNISKVEKELDVHLEAIAQQMYKNLPQTASTNL